MAQVTLCDGCGKELDEAAGDFARIQVSSSRGGGAQLDFHNSTSQPCFGKAADALKGVSKSGKNLESVSVAQKES